MHIRRDVTPLLLRQTVGDALASLRGQPLDERIVYFYGLLCNVGGGLAAALIATAYEPLLNAVIALALFIPVALTVSESIAMQSVTLTLQHLHGGPQTCDSC